MKLQDIKAGDILAYKGTSPASKLIELLTNSQYSHLCIYINDNQAIEADYDGVHYVNIDEYIGKLDVYRCCDTLTDSQRIMISNYAISQIGRRYNYFLLLYLFCKYLFKIKLYFRKFSKGVICSQLVNNCYKKEKIKLSKKKYPNPQEVISSKLLKFIGSY